MALSYQDAEKLYEKEIERYTIEVDRLKAEKDSVSVDIERSKKALAQLESSATEKYDELERITTKIQEIQKESSENQARVEQALAAREKQADDRQEAALLKESEAQQAQSSAGQAKANLISLLSDMDRSVEEIKKSLNDLLGKMQVQFDSYKLLLNKAQEKFGTP